MSTTDPADALAGLWADGGRPDLAEFLAGVGPLPTAVLAAVVRVDQARRWATGEHVAAETYFQRFPQLEADPDAAVNLVLDEFAIREKQGERPQPGEYLRRFPGFSEPLLNAFRARRANEPAPPHTVTDLSPPAGRPAGATVAPAGPLTETFGRYRIVRTLGRGGMGAVYLAHDTELQRDVALKVPLFDGADGGEAFSRFQREARIAATFHHPNLCPVYDVGRIDGTPFFTMPFLGGESLADFLKRNGPLPPVDACRLAMRAARAMQVAHDAGVRHRDLKPSNIMLVDGMQPVLMDFGLAKRAGPADARLTATGQVLGTCAYMPPEQIAGEPDVGPEGDVYSLGVILYETLTGRQPFQGSAREVLCAVLTEPPPPPRRLRPTLDPALEAICMKALAKAPADRFASMTQLAVALEPFAVDRGPVPDTVRITPEPPRKKSRALPIAALVAIVIGLAIGGYSALSPPRSSPPVETSPEKDESAALPTPRPETPREEPKPKDVFVAKAAPDGPLVLKQQSAANTLAFNPAAGNILAVGSQDGTVRLWDLKTGEMTAKWGPIAGPVLSVAFSPDGNRAATAGGDEPNLKWDVLLWDAIRGRVEGKLNGHSYYASAVAFSPDGKRVASGAGDNSIRLWPPTDGAEGTRLDGHTVWVRTLAFSPTQEILASAGDDETVRLWDLKTGKNTATWKGHERPVHAVAFAPDGKTVASAGEDAAVRLWSVADGKGTALKGHEGPVTAVAFSPDGKLIASGGDDHRVKVWDRATAKCIATLEGHDGRVNAVAFSADGGVIASASTDGTARIWKTPTP